MTLPGVIVAIGAIVAMFMFVSGRNAAQSAATTTTTVAGATTETTTADGHSTDGDSTDTTAAGGEDTTTTETTAGEGHSTDGEGHSTEGEDHSTDGEATDGEPAEDATEDPAAEETIAIAWWSPRVASCVAETDPPAAEVTRLVTEKPVFLYGTSQVDVRMRDGMLIGDVQPGNIVVIDGEDFELSQVVVAPTRHEVDGEVGAFEIRFVHHAIRADQVAVIARVVVQGAEPDADLDEFVKGRPEPGGAPEPRQIDLDAWAPKGTPVGRDRFGPAEGCGLVVRGLVSEPLEVSFDQIELIEELLAQE